jgi:integrase
MSGLFKHLPILGLQGVYNVASDVSIPKFDNSRSIELTDEEIKKLFDAIFTYHDIKIRTIFIWLLHGRRKSEVLKIKWESIDFANNKYTVEFNTTKGIKTLQYELTDVLITALNEYGIKKSGLVFSSNVNKGKPFSKSGIDGHWKKIREKSDINYLRMHDLRHVIGGFAVNKGYSLEITGKLLGHSTANITQRYARVQRKVIKNVVDDLFSTYKS